MSVPILAELLDGVEGWLIIEEAVLLHDLAAQVPAGRCIVEIGAYHGRSAIALASGAPDGVLVYSVDPHDEHTAGGYPFGMSDNQHFMRNVSAANLGRKVRVLNLPSHIATTVWRKMPHIGLLFVDGGHEYNDVEYDVRVWTNYLGNQGILAIHDSTGAWPYPTMVADELKQSDAWTELPGAGYTRLFRKDTP